MYNGEVAGIATIFSVLDHQRCNFGGWIEPKWRGHYGAAMCRQSIGFIHRELRIKHVFAATPWRSGRNICERAGMRQLAELPGYYARNGEDVDVSIYWSEAGVFAANERMREGE